MPDHLKGGLKHGKTDLQVAVEAELGVELCPVFFADAEQYARRKLEVANRSAGRKYGEDAYHNRIKQRIRNGEFSGHYFTDNYPRIGTALVLVFNTYPFERPIRPHRWAEYKYFLGGQRYEQANDT